MISGMPSSPIRAAHSPSWTRKWWKWHSRAAFARSVGPPSDQKFRWCASHHAGGRSSPAATRLVRGDPHTREHAALVADRQRKPLVAVVEAPRHPVVDDAGAVLEVERDQVGIAGESAGLGCRRGRAGGVGRGALPGTEIVDVDGDRHGGGQPTGLGERSGRQVVDELDERVAHLLVPRQRRPVVGSQAVTLGVVGGAPRGDDALDRGPQRVGVRVGDRERPVRGAVAAPPHGQLRGVPRLLLLLAQLLPEVLVRPVGIDDLQHPVREPLQVVEAVVGRQADQVRLRVLALLLAAPLGQRVDRLHDHPGLVGRQVTCGPCRPGRLGVGARDPRQTDQLARLALGDPRGARQPGRRRGRALVLGQAHALGTAREAGQCGVHRGPRPRHGQDHLLDLRTGQRPRLERGQVVGQRRQLVEDHERAPEGLERMFDSSNSSARRAIPSSHFFIETTAEMHL